MLKTMSTDSGNSQQAVLKEIDVSWQGKGYGSGALGLYYKFGFHENGEMNDEEIVLKLHLV